MLGFKITLCRDKQEWGWGQGTECKQNNKRNNNIPNLKICHCILEKMTGIPSLAVDTFEKLAAKWNRYDQYIAYIHDIS